MVTSTIAILLLLFFLFLTGIGVWAFSMLHKMGLMNRFMKGKWLASILTVAFIALFLVSGIGLLFRFSWALPLLQYTIYGWLAYLWVYNLTKIIGTVVWLKTEKAKSVDQLIGRNPFFDDLVGKTMAFNSVRTVAETSEEGQPVTDPSLDDLMHNEELFAALLPRAIRRKLIRKTIGLIIHTVIMVGLLLLLY